MQAVIDFVLGHQVVLASFVVGILDFIFALNKEAESSGVLHWIYLQAKAILAKKDGGAGTPPAA